MTPESLAKKIYDEICASELKPETALYGLRNDIEIEKSAPLGSPEAVRSAMQKFVDDFYAGREGGLNTLTIIRLLERILQVDMEDKSNHRGQLPKALGLIHRQYRDYENRVLVKTVYSLTNDLWSSDGIKRKLDEALEMAINALREAGIADLSLEKIKSLYELGNDL